MLGRRQVLLGGVFKPGTRASTAKAIAVDSSGNVVVTGQSSNGSNLDFWTVKFSGSTGQELWEKIYNGPADRDDIPVGVVLDSAGNAIVTGQSLNASNYDAYTAKYAASDGHLIWERRYNGTANFNDSAAAVAVDASGNAVITGYTEKASGDSDYYTAKYAATDGHVLWEHTYSGPLYYDSAAAVRVDASGNVAVTGASDGNSSGANFYTAKYAASDGHLLWEQRFTGCCIRTALLMLWP